MRIQARPRWSGASLGKQALLVIAAAAAAVASAGPALGAGSGHVLRSGPTAHAAVVGPVVPHQFSTAAGGLAAVAFGSPDDAWAVGTSGTSAALILRWADGQWTRAATPPLRGGKYPWLAGVAASSAANAWAVGGIGNQTLILHWNGSAWRRVPSPTPRGGAYLNAVTVTRSGAAWAVGRWGAPAGVTDLILRWARGRWQRVPNPPSPIDGTRAGEGLLFGVAASSGRNAWAVGSGAPGFPDVTLHWNGSAWKIVPCPELPGGSLSAVAVAPGGGAWAVGWAGARSLILRWRGGAWRRVTSPSPGGPDTLNSAASAPDGAAWAVGVTGNQALILAWNGHSWRRQPSPNITVAAGSGYSLSGVAALSSGNAWAVGTASSWTGVIVGWNGGQWQ